MPAKKKRKHPVMQWAIAIVIVAILSAIIINGLTHDSTDDREWENLHQTANVTTDTIQPGAIIDSHGIQGVVLIGEETDMAVKRLSAIFDIERIETGSDPSDVNYELQKEGKTHIVLQNGINNRIGAIFILDGEYFTDHGIGIGSTFASVFAAYDNAEMRLGETEDGINGSCELCKACDGLLFLKWLDDTGSTHIAEYDDSGIFKSFTDGYALQRVDEIIITPATW